MENSESGKVVEPATMNFRIPYIEKKCWIEGFNYDTNEVRFVSQWKNRRFKQTIKLDRKKSTYADDEPDVETTSYIVNQDGQLIETKLGYALYHPAIPEEESFRMIKKKIRPVDRNEVIKYVKTEFFKDFSHEKLRDKNINLTGGIRLFSAKYESNTNKIIISTMNVYKSIVLHPKRHIMTYGADFDNIPDVIVKFDDENTVWFDIKDGGEMKPLKNPKNKFFNDFDLVDLLGIEKITYHR